jgi:hypothetical protein
MAGATLLNGVGPEEHFDRAELRRFLPSGSGTSAAGKRRIWSGLVRRPLKPVKRDHGAHHTPDYDDQQVVSGPG